jgi:trehalose/maltose transport system substrate-binding protein
MFRLDNSTCPGAPAWFTFTPNTAAGDTLNPFRTLLRNRLFLLAASLTITSISQAATVTIACGSSGNDINFCQKMANEWGAKNGHIVKHYSPPNNPTEALALYRQLFAAKSTDIDVIILDTVWPGVLKDHLVDMSKAAASQVGLHFPAIVANNTVDGKLLGLPWYTDAGLLYYRKDLLDKHKVAVPTTWDEFNTAAKTVLAAERKAGNNDLQGFVFQAKAYEGLSCNALEWVSSFGGGTVIDSSGKVTINNPAAAKALNMAASWIGDIAPKGVLNYAEEDARGVFQSGKAVFMRNWPYAWSLTQKGDSPIKGKVGITTLPKNGAAGKPAATLGGWQLAVSKYSKASDAAVSLALHMSSAEVQKARAIEGSFNPTRPALYQDKDIAAQNPFMTSLGDVFSAAVARPATVTGLKYPEVSQAFWDATHDVLSKKSTGEEAVKKLEAKLNQIKRSKW